MTAPDKIYAWQSSTKPQGVSLAGGKVDDQIEYIRSDLIAARAADTRTVTVEQLEAWIGAMEDWDEGHAAQKIDEIRAIIGDTE